MVFKKPDTEVGHRVLIYGKPGCGKTTMMLKGLPRPLVAFDFDNSINILLAKPREESGIDPTDIYLADVPRDAENRLDYGAFLSILRDADNFDGVKSVLIDTSDSDAMAALSIGGRFQVLCLSYYHTLSVSKSPVAIGQ